MTFPDFPFHNNYRTLCHPLYNNVPGDSCLYIVEY